MPETSRTARRREAARGEGGAAYLERRAEVIRAAAQVFKTRGYQGTALGKVAETLGLDRATLYYYIESKEALFQEVVGTAVEHNCLAAEAIIAGPDEAPAKLRRLMVALMCSYADTYPFLYVYIQENLSNVSSDHSEWAHRMRQFNRRYERAIMAVVEAGVADGSFTADSPPRLVAYGILGMLAWSNRWYRPEDSPVSAEKIGETFAAMVVDGLCTRATAHKRRP